MKNLTKLPERSLDVLRATAVLLVLFAHVFAYHGWNTPLLSVWTLGRLGVLIFFVHTSLVLMSSLERGGFATGWVSRFYVRRAFRIYPLAWAAIFASVIFTIPPHAYPIAQPNVLPQITHGVLLANLTLSQNLFDLPSIQGVLWTLPLEVQMYVMLPLCFLVARRGPLGVLGLIALAFLLPFLGAHLPGFWRLSVVDYAPVFLIGVLGYSVLRRWPQTWDIPESRISRVGHVIATYSYGIYLLHVPALWIGFRVLRDAPAIVQWIAFLSALVLLPLSAYHLIEQPGIRAGQRLVNRRPMTRAATAPAP